MHIRCHYIVLHSYKINSLIDNNNKQMAVIPHYHTVETEMGHHVTCLTRILRIGRRYTDFVLKENNPCS